MGTGTGDKGFTQPRTADLPHSSGISGKKAEAPEEQMHCAGTLPEMRADAEKEDTAGTTAAAMPEIQENRDQNWWMCGESIPENERCRETADSICGEESGAYEENWWDMEEYAVSGIKNLCQETPPLCRSSVSGAGVDMESAAGIADAVDTVDIVDSVDNCRTAGKVMDEYQNSESEARSRETVFADKTVEAMVRELLWEQKTGLSGGVSECVREPQDVSGQTSREPEIQNGEGQDTVIVENKLPEQWDSKRNDTEYSKTEYSKTEKNENDFSAVYTSYQSYQSSQTDVQGQHAQDRKQPVMSPDGMDAYRECIRENIDYQCFRPQDMESVDELVELMADTMMVPDRGTVRVAGAEKPASIVKSRFMKLAHSHIEYVMECLQKHAGKIRNIRAYLLTALYNSSLTISSYYRAEVNHDLYGFSGLCGC